MAVVVPPTPMRVVRNLSGDTMAQYQDQSQLSAGTNTFKKGELVTLPIAGAVTKADAVIVGAGNDKLDVSATANTVAKKIWGIATKDEGAVATAVIPVDVFQPGQVVEGNLMTGTDGDYTVGGAMEYTLLATDLYRKVAILFDATNRRWYFTVTATEECATIIAVPGIAGVIQGGGGVGDKNVRVQAVIDLEITKFGALVTTA